MKRLVVLSGAGVSAESGLRTFREMGGLWEEYDVMEVASPRAWDANPKLVLKFYNERRKQLLEAKPNEGHKNIAKLEKYFDVDIITQNIDNLHEQAGSNKVLHLHGELKKARSVKTGKVYDIKGWELKLGDVCEQGHQLRPHIVWFGEAVPAMNEAVEIANQADILVIVGTSLNVYPAAGLVNCIKENVPIFLIDPNDVEFGFGENIMHIKEQASIGVKRLKEILLKK